MASAMPLHADEPLTPPQDFIIEYEGASIVGDVSAGTTTVSPRDGPAWIIPVWARWFQISQDQRAALVLNTGGNLLGSRDADQIVATVWYLEDETVRSRPVTLSETMDPSDMPQSTSHFVWLTSYRAVGNGWELDLSDGRTVTITFR